MLESVLTGPSDLTFRVFWMLNVFVWLKMKEIAPKTIYELENSILQRYSFNYCGAFLNYFKVHQRLQKQVKSTFDHICPESFE